MEPFRAMRNRDGALKSYVMKYLGRKDNETYNHPRDL